MCCVFIKGRRYNLFSLVLASPLHTHARGKNGCCVENYACAGSIHRLWPGVIRHECAMCMRCARNDIHVENMVDWLSEQEQTESNAAEKRNRKENCGNRDVFTFIVSALSLCTASLCRMPVQHPPATKQPLFEYDIDYFGPNLSTKFTVLHRRLCAALQIAHRL